VLENLNEIAEGLIQDLTARNQVREEALLSSRKLIRSCANTIRAVHREEKDAAAAMLAEAREAALEMKGRLLPYPDLYFAGYTQDAMKEYVEASATYALVYDEPLPTPQELGMETVAYLQGLAEAASELRRRILDIIRHDRLQEGERCLDAMEEIYNVLVTIDFPSALTGGLRRTTDMVRGVLERTRGDFTVAMRQSALQQALREFEERLNARQPAGDAGA